MDPSDLVVGIGGAAGDGVASAGNSLALARQGLGFTPTTVTNR